MPRKARQPRVIRRYGRCRLYDPASGAYVSLSELMRWRADGEKIVVREADTGQDVTDEIWASGTMH
ncbi:polyhydroxyalkanoate synthesis regulator DNA-binding domain-containing protein [Methylobacterium nigriterrae]|uniref:polyhydroxyalkanoate synthesis regulator DNA-binding domain-containing protein n=1 Tax=Methylobacterium nigriterrae TaxID=3127512 RepID=UPI003013AE49